MLFDDILWFLKSILSEIRVLSYINFEKFEENFEEARGK